jgi:hypothetical protein
MQKTFRLRACAGIMVIASVIPALQSADAARDRFIDDIQFGLSDYE